MSLARFWTPFGFLALIPVSFALGGPWTFLLLPVLPLTLVAFDGLLGEEPPDWDASRPIAYRLLPWAYIPAQLAVIGWGAFEVSQASTPLVESIGLTLSIGLTTGVFGFIAAHEMIHSRHKGERLFGLVMLAPLFDMQFAIAHVQGHHRRPATFEDPASARRGESLYAFVIRSLAGQWREAWAFETHRLLRAGHAALSPRNRLVIYALVEAALFLAVAAWSWRALAFVIADAALAVFLLESFNYIAHYGLIRRRDEAGRLEPLRPKHSWNSARRMNNAALFNMGRHADHHRFSSRPYPELEVLDGASFLPGGYAASLVLALLPPVWRRVMDPRVDAALATH